MSFKKTTLLLTAGIVLLANALSCLVVFMVTYNEKKSLSSAFWAMCLTFGAIGSALVALADARNEDEVRSIKKKMAKHDHWFHSFEYPECTEPTVTIDDTYIPPVETEE